MIIKTSKNDSVIVNSKKLIEIFEKEKNFIQIDKFGYEYIDCTKLPEKYDKDTQFLGKILETHSDKIKLFETSKEGLRLDYVQIRKYAPGNIKPYSNEKAWNRLDIHIPINKSVGGAYKFSSCTIGTQQGTLLFFDPLEEHWSIDETKNIHYKIILRFRNLDKTLSYSGQEINDEV